MSRSSVWGSSATPFKVVFLMWLVFYLELVTSFPFTNFGIRPLNLVGLIGVVVAPLLHGNLNHLVSNTIPLLFLGTVLFFFYPKIAGVVFMRCWFLTNLLVWLFAWRQSVHIGASGLVYGLAFFLIFFGIFKRDFLSMLISIIILLMYGGIFYGVLPSDPRISWESHFAGALVGIYTAVTFGKNKQVS
jgi:membrane associated rhomboid family serine protease